MNIELRSCFCRVQRAGFTLMEMSIVLVVIGLIIGGVIVGTHLMEVATLRSITTHYQELSTAINSFRLKYNCLPGDCPKATSFFGTSCPGLSSYSGDNETCNGNGDTKISGYTETRYFCQHLQRAGLIDSTCQGGFDNPPTGGVLAGVNAIESKFQDDVLVEFGWMTTASVNLGHIIDGNHMYLAKGRTASWSAYHYTSGGLLSIDQGRRIDEKMDDGKPLTGKLVNAYSYCGDQASNTYTGVSTYTACANFYRFID